MVTIAVDAMGGDHAPKAEVEGAIQAVRSLDVKVILVGREEIVTTELAHHHDWRKLPIEVHHASAVLTMEDSAARVVRQERDSSIGVASRLVRVGRADGVVRAGSTGAGMATAEVVEGLVPVA